MLKNFLVFFIVVQTFFRRAHVVKLMYSGRGLVYSVLNVQIDRILVVILLKDKDPAPP